jgi:hypothetical protein
MGIGYIPGKNSERGTRESTEWAEKAEKALGKEGAAGKHGHLHLSSLRKGGEMEIKKILNGSFAPSRHRQAGPRAYGWTAQRTAG